MTNTDILRRLEEHQAKLDELSRKVAELERTQWRTRPQWAEPWKRYSSTEARMKGQR